MIDDLRRLARFARASARRSTSERIAVRGSSMGGLMAIHLARGERPRSPRSSRSARRPSGCCSRTCGAVADGQAAAARQRARRDAHRRPGAGGLAGGDDVGDAVERMGAKPLLLIHARGDEVVPYTHSEELYERAAEPKRLLLLEGGDHRSAQHDAELQGESLRWLARAMQRGCQRRPSAGCAAGRPARRLDHGDPAAPDHHQREALELRRRQARHRPRRCGG